MYELLKKYRKELYYFVICTIAIFSIGSIILFEGNTFAIILILIAFALIAYELYRLNKANKNKARDMNEMENVMHQYQNLYEHIPVPMLIFNKTKIIHANHYCLALLAAPCKEMVVGKPFEDFFKNDEWWQSLNKKLYGNMNGKLLRVDGEWIDVKLHHRQMEFENEPVYGIVIKDLTNVKENEKKLRHSEQLSVIGELAAGIAHEIRNPLTSLMGFLQLLGARDKNAEPYKEIMASELERINLIVNELLLLSKPKEYEYETTNIVHLLRTVITIANTQAILHNIEISLKIEDNEEMLIDCEQNKLKQVFLNLIKNAIEAMEDHNGVITIAVRKKLDKVEISFIDQGKGIPEEKIENLGKRFYTTKEDGTGLGLMISMNIIGEHDGEMYINSKLNVGTTITVLLPTE
ncbi:ATP-binding protein [Evansella cellulosilytica]|uniref:histidine kinase n=1 Tax=Evansella cellulosilytica (strain ATCC 21833 / DSM 2522 / FERM P-1141 / JCM 9156 / N-4) TaxID=649639 RepID=E6TYA2_EVAC2|nr:ATP-binding protein [Evansella cellulosilytica]ADU32421.1 integral membrane sensor signal transduction histidine kinase [Evansella cellulosilytica DSM 2522]